MVRYSVKILPKSYSYLIRHGVMNIVLAEHEEIVNRCITVTDNRAVHMVKILRVAVGDTVRLGIVNGPRGIGTVRHVEAKHPRSVTLSIELTEPVAELPPIDLVVALARPIMMRRILSQATAMGVGRFFFIHANRVEKSFWEASLLEPEGYEEHLRQGLEQAVDTRMPEVNFYRKFKPFVEDVLPKISKDYSHKLIAHPSGTHSLNAGLAGEHRRVLLAIGPEGGWVDYEVEKFGEAGVVSCTLGKRILKVDTAVVALHSRVSQILER